MSIGSLLAPLAVTLLVSGPDVLVYGGLVADDETKSAKMVQGRTGTPANSVQDLGEGDARIWYLGHCGWAVKTRSRVLIFDYWEREAVRGDPSLANGKVDPAELRDLDVYVFVSHSHGDHYENRQPTAPGDECDVFDR